MKTYQVVLTKSYTVTIKAGSKQQARHVAEFYTDDIKDISIIKDREKHKFSIEEIECGMNESLRAEEMKDE